MAAPQQAQQVAVRSWRNQMYATEVADFRVNQRSHLRVEMDGINNLDVIELAHNRRERAADGAQRLAETLAAMRRHQQHAPLAEVDLRKLFIVEVVGERQ